MDLLSPLLAGLEVALSPYGLLFTFVGIVLGQIVGALPGVGSASGMALLLPVIFGMDPVYAMIMLSGIMYGTKYGDTLSGVLINVPGDAASVMTAVEGNQLARKGQAGKALSIAAIASFVGGTVSVVALAVAAPALSAFALRFSSPEYVLLATLGLTASVGLGSSNMIKALLATMAGLLVALVGVDPMRGVPRLTFGFTDLIDGIHFLPIAIGLFGIAEVFNSFSQNTHAQKTTVRLQDIWPTWADWIYCRMSILRGTIIGFFIGIMPGAGAPVASFLAYFSQQRVSKRPEDFGEGARDGIAAAESANNAASHGTFVPMLALGIPGSPGTAVLLGALILLGIRPGPNLMEEQSVLVWGLIASMFTGNIMLLILNLPLAPVFASLLRIPYQYLAPAIIMIALVGAYAQTLNVLTLVETLFFGMLGYFMIRTNFPRAPFVLAVVLAPIIESSLRQSLMFSEGSLLIFIERPISALLLVAVILSLVAPALMVVQRRG